MLHCCRLILSGGPGPEGNSSSAQAMAQLALELGVSRQDIILEALSGNTEDEARRVAPIVGQQPFILVTEASHMPRAMAFFRKLGTHPIADPMGFRTTPGEPITLLDLAPDAEELSNS